MPSGRAAEDNRHDPMKTPAVSVAAFTFIAFISANTAPAQNRQVAATRRAEWIRFNPVTPLTADSFAKPPVADLPWVRMNMPPTADPKVLAAEVRDLREHGVAGVEIGQGAFPNNEQLIALLTAANEVGIRISLSHGPTQNPAGYSIDDDHARKTLVVGRAMVSAGQTSRASADAHGRGAERIRRIAGGGSRWR